MKQCQASAKSTVYNPLSSPFCYTCPCSCSDITRIFSEIDAVTPAAASADIGIKLTGRSGELIKEVYIATSKKAGAFDKIIKDLDVSSGFLCAGNGESYVAGAWSASVLDPGSDVLSRRLI